MDLTSENYFYLKSLGLKRAEIADKFGIPEWKLKKLIAQNSWGKIAPKIEFEDAFSYLDELSCYWAGFIAADGNVDHKNRVRVMLNYDDSSHLQKLKEFLGAEHKISSNTDTYYRSSLELTSKRICSDLKTNFNIIPNKTDRLVFPHHLSIEGLKSYIRGYFDGDGSICESFSNKNSRTTTLYATFASGSKNFCKDLFQFLGATLSLGGSVQTFSESKQQIKYNTNDAKTLLNWMYKDAEVYLDRKYEKYINLVVYENRAVR